MEEETVNTIKRPILGSTEKNLRNFQFKQRSAVIKMSGAIINVQNVSSIKNVDASYTMLNDI